MESLRELYAQHDGRVSQRWSSYLTTLDRTLSSRRDDPVRMLEIGVQNGGSLEIWARYLPEAERLVGCDIDAACAALTFDDPRIHVVVGDVTEPDVRSTIAGHSEQFDVIIDDGSHRSADIITAFVTMFPGSPPEASTSSRTFTAPTPPRSVADCSRNALRSASSSGSSTSSTTPTGASM